MIHSLEADSIQLSFGLKKVLTDVYIKCETGKITGLLGRNGQGKTCLMNIMTGNMKATNRFMRFDNTPFMKAADIPGLLMYLPQFNFIPKGLTLSGIFNDFQLEFSLLEKTFPEFRLRHASTLHELSGGQRRLIEVYIIIKSKTRFALLDEPFTHIMPLHIEKLSELLVAEKQTKGILITDHLYEHITGICDNLYVLNNGKTHFTENFSDLEKYGYANKKNPPPGIAT